MCTVYDLYRTISEVVKQTVTCMHVPADVCVYVCECVSVSKSVHLCILYVCVCYYDQ